MCCFSGRVQEVSGTRIFARSTGKDRQILAYSMSVSADADLAMILPLPVPPSPPEDAVRFIDLSGYPTLFLDLEKAFPQSRAIPQPRAAMSSAAAINLRVQDVGDFEASFVPRLADFSRLDPRFQLPKQVWDKLPDYKDWGFAVFKLRGGAAGRAEKKAIHPMAFEFPIRPESKIFRKPPRLFFPTVHVHDGEVHRTAAFDHVLYFQGHAIGHEASERPVAKVVDVARAAGVIDAGERLYQMRLDGRRKNEDTYVKLAWA